MHHWVNSMNLSEYLEALPWGGKKIIALRLGVTASYLSRLVSGDRSITAERAIQIEEATCGVVTRSELRPDIQWSPARREIYPDPSPTLNANVRPNPSERQSTVGAVNPSSTAQASA